MNRFFLFLLLFATCSFSTDINACIVLPSNSVTVNGPSSVCASNPVGSYSVNYSTGQQGPYEMVISVQGGTVSNVQAYTLVVGVPLPGDCVPVLSTTSEDDCYFEQVYAVPQACRGGVSFDVTWDEDCNMEENLVEGLLFPTSADFEGDAQTTTIDGSCFGGGDPQGLGSMGGSVDESEESLAVNIFPNPATDSNVTISLPSDYDNCEVNILDINGKLVQSYSKVNDQLLVNTSELNGSFYFVQVITVDGKVDTQKLMLTK